MTRTCGIYSGHESLRSSLARRVSSWVLLTEAPDGGWGLWGHAHTNAELVSAARAEAAQLSDGTGG